MPYSYNLFKNDVKSHMIAQGFSPDMNILDVGAGAGAYSHLLRNIFYNMDALEIWQPYVQQFKLHDLYRNVIIGNIMEFDFSEYDYLIMGDIFEHLSIEDATKLLDKINTLGKKCLIAVPYMYPQGIEFGNVYESHLQEDLTPEIFLERYPSMRLLFGDNKYGYYVNY